LTRTQQSTWQARCQGTRRLFGGPAGWSSIRSPQPGQTWAQLGSVIAPSLGCAGGSSRDGCTIAAPSLGAYARVVGTCVNTFRPCTISLERQPRTSSAWVAQFQSRPWRSQRATPARSSRTLAGLDDTYARNPPKTSTRIASLKTAGGILRSSWRASRSNDMSSPRRLQSTQSLSRIASIASWSVIRRACRA